MIIIPAIDIIGGNCVRLKKGDYSTAHKVAEDLFETARSFQNKGAQYLHMVDLDGAKEKRPCNFEIITTVARELDIPVEIGGGIRDLETCERYLKAGLSRVILGSAALTDAAFLKQAVAQFGSAVAVGIDADNRKVKINGWQEGSDEDYIDFAKRVEDIGVATIIFTDISRDGMLQGPNIALLEELKNAVTCNIIASGGVSSLKDIQALIELSLYGAIAGKALYTGDLVLEDAIALCKDSQRRK